MSAQVPRVVVQTRRRLYSDDFNRGARLQAKALLEAMYASMAGDSYSPAGVGLGGVVGGYMVEALPGTLSVRVQPGIALVAATPAEPTYDPPLVWVELAAAETIDLTPLVDPAQPRLVTIELEPAEGALVTDLRDVFDPALGTFNSVMQTIVSGSEPVLVATPGAASASPVIAAGTPGRLPLAIIKLPAAHPSFTDPFLPVLMCRPLLVASSGERWMSSRYVRGGGCSVGQQSGGTWSLRSSITIHDFEATLRGIPAEIRGFLSFAVTGRTPVTTSPATLLATAGPVYGYAVPPPWPSDYGTIAPREAWARNPNALALSGESVVLGAGTTFASLATAIAAGLQGPGCRSAIPIWDSVAPSGLTVVSPADAHPRVDNARGPHPNTAPGGSGSITLTAAQDPTWGPSQVVTESVYLGAVSSVGTGNAFMAQSYRGKGSVRAVDIVDLSNPANTRRPTKGNVTVTTGILDLLYPGRYPSMDLANPEILPASATTVDVYGLLTVGTAGNQRLALASRYGYGAAVASPALIGVSQVLLPAADLQNSAFGQEVVRLERSATDGAIAWYFQAGTGGRADVCLTGYDDAFLAAR